MTVIEIGPNLQRVMYLLIILLFIDVFIIYFTKLLNALKEHRENLAQPKIEEIRQSINKGYSDVLTKLLMKKNRNK